MCKCPSPPLVKAASIEGLVHGIKDSIKDIQMEHQENALDIVLKASKQNRDSRHMNGIEWKIVRTIDGIQISQGQIGGSAWKCLRGTVKIDAPPRAVYENLLNAEALPQVDDMLGEIKVLEHTTTATGVIEVRYMKYKPVWPTSARDFVIETSGRELGGGSFAIGSRTVQRDDVPPISRVVRAELMMAGYLVQPSADGKSTELTMFSHIDLKGNIPAMVINQLGTTAPAKLLAAIRKYAEARPGRA